VGLVYFKSAVFFYLILYQTKRAKSYLQNLAL